MTISSETRTAGPFSGNGSTTAFPFTFKVFSTNDVVVVLTDTDGVEDTLTLTTDYTVSLNADQDTSPGGTVTMLTAPATGELLTLTSAVGNLQPIEITNQGGFYPNVINKAFDRATILIQQLLNKINRSIKIPLSDGTSITTELPTATLRANKALVFDADGNIDVSADDYEDQAANAAASAAAAAASAVTAATQATTATTQASTATTQASNASSSASAAAASAVAAQTAVSSMMWQDVVFLTVADSPYTIGASDSGKMYAVDCSGGNVTINLPSIAALTLALPWAIGIKKTDSSTNTILVDADGTDTIDGGANKTLSTPDAGATFIPDTDTAPDEWTTAEFGATAGNITIQNFSGDGSTTAFTLSSDPGTENNTDVFISGVYQQKNTYSVSGTTLTFSSAPASGTNNIEVRIISTLPIGTPSDGTVTTAKLADDAVTYAKMQNVSATSRVLGRKTAGAGDAEECTLSEVLDFVGSAAQGDVLYRDASSWSRLGAGTSGQFLKTQGAAANPTWADTLTSSSQTTSSGTSKDFTSLPAGIKRITLVFNGVSTNGADHFLLQLGDSGGFENSGYDSSHDYGGFVRTSTSGFILTNIGASRGLCGSITLHHVGGNLWVASAVARPDSASAGGGGAGCGIKGVSAELDRVRFTTTGGTDTFDSGSVTIFYE